MTLKPYFFTDKKPPSLLDVIMEADHEFVQDEFDEFSKRGDTKRYAFLVRIAKPKDMRFP